MVFHLQNTVLANGSTSFQHHIPSFGGLWLFTSSRCPLFPPPGGGLGSPPNGLTSYYHQHMQGYNYIYINNQILRRGQINEVPVFP